MLLLIDVDGTLSDHRHRLQLVAGPGKKDYPAFYQQMVFDPPIPEAQSCLFHLTERKNIEVRLLTGRPEEYRQVTRDWLDLHFPFLDGAARCALYMRTTGDHTKSTLFKERVVQSLMEEDIVFVDDDERNAEMYGRYGIYLKAPECWRWLR